MKNDENITIKNKTRELSKKTQKNLARINKLKQINKQSAKQKNNE